MAFSAALNFKLRLGKRAERFVVGFLWRRYTCSAHDCCNPRHNVCGESKKAHELLGFAFGGVDTRVDDLARKVKGAHQYAGIATNHMSRLHAESAAGDSIGA